MLYLDYLAYNNRLRNVSITEKLTLGGGGLVLALALPHPITLLCIILLMHIVMIYAARISLKFIGRLWMAPLAFLLVGLITVLFSMDTLPFPALIGVHMGSYYIGITEPGLFTAQILFLRSLAAISCLFMVATSTPVAHIAAYVARFKMLNTVMEITLLTYRFIFVFLETAGKIYTAQQSRLGYAGTRRSLRSLSLLAANLGSKSFLTARELYTALLARNYADRLVFRYPQQKIQLSRFLLIIFVLLGVAATAVL